MKTHALFLFPFLCLGLISCNNPSSGALSQEGDDTSGDTLPPIDEEDNSRIDHITLNKKEVILEVNKRESLIVNFFPKDPNDNLDDCKDGTWSSSNPSVAEVSQYGVVSTKALGKAIISYVTNEGKRKANCVFYVVQDKNNLKKEYQRVDNLDSIGSDDYIVFACPEANLTASTTRKDKSLVPTTATFSTDHSKITSMAENTSIFLVSELDDGLTLENQNNEFLAAKYLKCIDLIPSYKGAITWAFEYIDNQPGVSIGNYVYSTYESIEGWLMFNTKAMKFTLYDSSVQVDMFLPTIYREVIVLD